MERGRGHTQVANGSSPIRWEQGSGEGAIRVTMVSTSSARTKPSILLPNHFRFPAGGSKVEKMPKAQSAARLSILHSRTLRPSHGERAGERGLTDTAPSNTSPSHPMGGGQFV